MAFRFPVKAYTRAQLDVMAGPVRASDLEAIPHVFHDVGSNQFTSASTTSIKYWNTNQATLDLGNFTGGTGQLPDPQYFQPFYFGCDPLILPSNGTSAGALTGALDDMERLVLTTRPTVNFQISGKPYIVDIPLSFLHTSGGATGLGWGLSTKSIMVANNSIPDGGWCVYGGFVIPPKQNVVETFTWSAVVTIAATTPYIRAWMAGVLFRRVL